MNRKLKKLLEIGIINTIRMNLYYFGVGGVLKPVILASKHVKIQCLKGNVIAHDMSRGAIQLGFGYVGTVDKKYRRTLWENSGTIEFFGKSNLGLGTKITCSGKLSIGKRVSINANSDIICRKEISIGNDSLMSWECLLMDSDFHSIYEIDSKNRINPDKPIRIGDRVWIGCRSTILKGCEIPDDSIIAACSTVTKSFTEGHAVYGNDMVLKRNIEWGHGRS